MTIDEAYKLAKAGERLLDEKGPENWRAKINRTTLNMSRLSECTLGQVYGLFEDGLTALGLTQNESIRYGFYIYVEDCPGGERCFCISVYEPLTAAWLEILPALSLQVSPALTAT